MRGRIVFLSAVLMLGSLIGPAARAEDKPLKIGLISDMSGPYADFFGEGSVISAQLAIEDAGGMVAGRKIELLTADHQSKPDIGASIARKMIEVDGVDAIIDVPTSSVALAVSEVVREKNKTFLATGPFTSALTGANCSPNTIHWSLDNWALAHTIASAEVANGGKTWFFVTSDYAFGHDLEKVATESVDTADGKAVVDRMKALPTDDVIFGKGSIRPDGRKIHAMYLYETKTPAESHEPWDYFKVKATIAAEDAFRPLSEGHCPLIK